MEFGNKKKILITTAIDYVNDVIHIGHSYQKILADTLARYARLRYGKKNVFFLTGTDEFGTTNEKAAEKRGLTPEQHVEEISAEDKRQLDSLNISYDRFIRTTDEDHKKTAAGFLQKAQENSDIYKGKYVGHYCEGCESHKTLSELDENGQCPLHKTRQIRKLDEENYFFKWSKYENFLINLLEKNEGFCIPEGKRKEMLSFLNRGLKDLPVSRPKYKVSWGIPIREDPDQVIYVWFDALVNYFTAANPKGFWDEDTFILHILGKDNTRFHALLWPAMLKSAGYRLPDTIYSHGFVNLEGQKISKSLGNVIKPTELVDKYGVDTVRYYFLKHGPIVEDVNISLKHLEEVYNADLANGLGNTVARIAKLAENSGIEFETKKIGKEVFSNEVFAPIEKTFRVDLVLQNIWKKLSKLDKHINENEPWAIKDKKKLREVLQQEIDELRIIAKTVEPFIPEASEKIQRQFKTRVIKSQKILFPRI